MKLLFVNLTIIGFNFLALGQSKAVYKIRSEYCSEGQCSVRAYVKAKHLVEANMQNLAEELAEKYKDKETVNIRVFDNEKIIKAYIDGKREPINIGSDSRVYFIHKANCGDILFYKAKKNKVKTIKLGWKNNEQCNKPFFIF